MDKTVAIGKNVLVATGDHDCTWIDKKVHELQVFAALVAYASRTIGAFVTTRTKSSAGPTCHERRIATCYETELTTRQGFDLAIKIQECTSIMQKRKLGNTDLELPILSFGASSLGQEFRAVSLEEVFESIRVARDLGLTLIDTSPFYGRGMSEVLLGIALRDVPRSDYLMCSKLGRYDINHFDFSAKRVAESIDVSLHRLGCDHLDIALCHDIEFVPLQQVIEETIPALRKAKQAGKVRYIGISGYPQKIFHTICAATEIDCVMSYNQYTLQNTAFADKTIPMLKSKGIGVMNAGPFSARLLTNAVLPPWFRDPMNVQMAAKEAATFCELQGTDIAKIALQFSLKNEDISTTVAGSANPNNIRKWVQWANEPLDDEILEAVLEILQSVHNIGHSEGLPENN